MIIVGTAEVNSSTGQVELKAPMGFNTAEGVRLSNFNGDTITITGINGRDQSQEYLAPQTQMVYATANVGIVPTVVGFSAPAEQIATNLLVEWSTDPTNDFIGTYPAALPVAPTLESQLTKIASVDNIPTDGTSVTLGKPTSQYAVVSGTIKGSSGASPSRVYIVTVFEGDANTQTYASSVTGTKAQTYFFTANDDVNTIDFAIPIQVTGLNPVCVSVFDPAASPTADIVGSVQLFETKAVLNVPTQYCEACIDTSESPYGILQYTSNNSISSTDGVLTGSLDVDPTYDITNQPQTGAPSNLIVTAMMINCGDGTIDTSTFPFSVTATGISPSLSSPDNLTASAAAGGTWVNNQQAPILTAIYLQQLFLSGQAGDKTYSSTNFFSQISLGIAQGNSSIAVSYGVC